MKIYYSKGWAITFIIAGILLLVLYQILFNLTGKTENIRMVPGFFMTLVGFLYLFQPYFELQDKSLVTFSLLGMVTKRFTYNNYSDFSFDGNKLYISKNGKLKKIRISRFVSNKKQWEEFVLKISRFEPGSELHE